MNLETERLTLRPWQMGDAEGLYGLFGDRQVRDALMLEGETSLEEMRGFLAETLNAYAGYPAPSCYWAICERETGDICGATLIRPLRLEPERMEVGWALQSRYWGRGYATEAVRRVCSFGLEHCEALHATIRPSNVRSVRVAEKLGMTRVEHRIPFEIELDLYVLQRTP